MTTKAQEIAERIVQGCDFESELVETIAGALVKYAMDKHKKWEKAGYEEGYRRGIEDAAKIAAGMCDEGIEKTIRALLKTEEKL